MKKSMPQRTRTYQNHHIDSLRWDHFKPRNDDIVIATPYKSGTTWMQGIVGSLILPEEKDPTKASPWIDNRVWPIDEVINDLEEQTHRRFIKTHLLLDGLIYYPQIKYIVVGRDARDVFMSLWNHYRSFTPLSYERFNNTPGRVGDPFPACPNDIRAFWQMWIARGWFEWESEGYPFWSNFRHVQTWWDFRNLDNILLVHYGDLLQDPGGEIQRVAEYLEIEVSEERLNNIVDATRFDKMRQAAIGREKQAGGSRGRGARSHFYKGTNGRWKGVLTEDDLKLYEVTVERELSPDCTYWLEHGRH